MEILSLIAGEKMEKLQGRSWLDEIRRLKQDHIPAAVQGSLKVPAEKRSGKRDGRKHPGEKCLTQQWRPVGKIQDANSANYLPAVSDEFCDFNFIKRSTCSRR